MAKNTSTVTIEVSCGAATYRRTYKTSEVHKTPYKNRKVDVDITMSGYAFPVVTLRTGKDEKLRTHIFTLRSDDYGKLLLTTLFLNVLLRDANLRNFFESCSATHGTIKIAKGG